MIFILARGCSSKPGKLKKKGLDVHPRLDQMKSGGLDVRPRRVRAKSKGLDDSGK